MIPEIVTPEMVDPMIVPPLIMGLLMLGMFSVPLLILTAWAKLLFREADDRIWPCTYPDETWPKARAGSNNKRDKSFFMIDWIDPDKR